MSYVIFNYSIAHRACSITSLKAGIHTILCTGRQAGRYKYEKSLHVGSTAKGYLGKVQFHKIAESSVTAHG